MPEDAERKTESTEGGLTDVQKRVLDEQRLVNEREDVPSEFGGMPERPVESDEPRARPSPQDVPAPQGNPHRDKDEDIQMEGS